ncbi:MAG: NigD-like protein [Mangrovibacterium sp.]
MKELLKLSLIGLLALGLFGCDLNDDDDYSLGKFWVGFGVVNFDDSEGTSYTVKMDNGSELFPVNIYRPHGMEDRDRILVNYTIVGDKLVTDETRQYFVKINSMKDILFKGIFDITPETEDSIGNDPVHVKDVWRTDSLLTFELGFYGNGGIHYINLVKEPGELTADDQPIQLEMRHNDNNDEPRYSMSAFVSFTLSAIQLAGQDSVSYVVTGDDYDGETFTYEGVYRY